MKENTERWKLNRIGLLNFWFYDEDEFQLEEGRLILRGANGSGKSVTMQSFLPLVLDGDKRSHRLDPFGSRDRRIEYYLLGEEEGGKSDTTGYLWMEFRHSGSGLFKTIGIGLRARRGAAQVQFWGFVLEDGRRVGRDFWLYHRNDFLEKGIRYPLDRKELTSEVGEGGQVVQDQSSYRDLVNKQLFGFAEPEAYQDLLQLMIQLRSPKLSKDFKPSAIYEILHQALPPLLEEELAPLSEVLEDMDQIADRLEEIVRHRGEMGRLHDVYDRYNRFVLYEKSDQLLAAGEEYGDKAGRAYASRRALEQAEERKAASGEELIMVRDRLQELAAERQVLEQHEAIGKQREYEAAVQSLAETDKQLERSRERQRKSRERADKHFREFELWEAREAAAWQEQARLLEDMELLSQETEFAGHPVYHRYWQNGAPEEDGWLAAWKRDVGEHRRRVAEAAAKARQEREAAIQARDREVELGEASRLKDEAERSRKAEEARLAESKEEWKTTVLAWQSQLRHLHFADDAVRETFAAIRAFLPDAPHLEPIREPLHRRYSADHAALVERRLRLEGRRAEVAAERDRLAAEKAAWEASREPEPRRTEARTRARAELPAGSGAPLYAACDFRAEVEDGKRAAIEEAMERAGLLDAWICPDGAVLSSGEDREEAWIVPNPIDLGFTLADVLVPAPSEESGLAEEAIDRVLRTFYWDEFGDGEDWGDSAGGVITGSGLYRLGALAGETVRKPRAEFIGKETRRRTRQLEIARLAEAIAALEAELAELASQLNSAAAEERALAAERDAFPLSDEAQARLRALQEAGFRLDATIAQEARALERFKEKSAAWRELQRELHELTAAWSRLKKESELEQALAALRDYEAELGELHSHWRQHREAAAAKERAAEERQAALAEVEDEEQQADELAERRRALRGQTEALRALIEELGLQEVASRLLALKTEEAGLLGRRKEADRQLDAAKEEAAKASAQLDLLLEQAEELLGKLNGRLAEWRDELRHGLTAEGRAAAERLPDRMPDRMPDRLPESGEAVREAAREASGEAARLVKALESQFAGRNPETIKNNLLDQFNATRMLLTEYVLQTVIDEKSGRILLWSMRDPAHPLPPEGLLAELADLEAEQRSLLSEKDRQLYEEIILRSVGKSIRGRIHRAEQWVREMNRLMEERDTSSGLQLKLEWRARPAASEEELDTLQLVELLKRDSHILREDELDGMIRHFRARIGHAKERSQEEQESLRKHLYETLDYRNWFQFELKFRKGEQIAYRPLTDSRFNVLSGGEKAMAMYIPLFAATWSRCSDARPDAPRLISLDEAFAGVDEENMRDLFQLLTEMGFDYIMTSQVLWGCYDTVPALSICEIYRPKDADFVTVFRYRWDGAIKQYVDEGVMV